MVGRGEAPTTRPSHAFPKDASFAKRTFQRNVVRSCVARAHTSLGWLVPSDDAYVAWELVPRHGTLTVSLGVADVIFPGFGIGFTGDERDARRFASRLAAVNRLPDSPLAARLVVRRRGNAVLFYAASAPPELVRIAQGCLGGPPYRGDGYPPPVPPFPLI